MFDLNGFIALPGLLTDEQVAELKADAKGVENNGPSAQENFGNSDGGVLHWNRTYRDVMAHPGVVPILEELCGQRFRLDHVNVHTHVADGYPGSSLHGGHSPGNGSGFFFARNGQMMNGLLAVTYELEDTIVNGGGFCCIPGSHKSNVDLPFDRDLSKPLHSAVQPIPLAAGDCVIFTEALIHGTMPWTTPGKTRTTLFYKYNPNGCAWSADFFDPADYAHYEDMTPERLAMLEPPNARYPGRPTLASL